MFSISTVVVGDYWGVAGDKEVAAGAGSQAVAACTSDHPGASAEGSRGPGADHTSAAEGGSDHTAAGGTRGPPGSAAGRRGCTPWAWGCTPGRAWALWVEWDREGDQEHLKCALVSTYSPHSLLPISPA